MPNVADLLAATRERHDGRPASKLDDTVMTDAALPGDRVGSPAPDRAEA